MSGRSGLGALITATRQHAAEEEARQQQPETTQSVQPGPEIAATPPASAATAGPAEPVDPPPAEARKVMERASPRGRASMPEALPKRVGNAPVHVDRQGRPYVPKSLNLPLDVALAIQHRVGIHQRDEDGSVTWSFQDIVIDFLRRALDTEKKRP